MKHLSITLRSFVALGLLGGLGLAQTRVSIGGALSDSTTGPLLADTVYHTTGSLSVAAGQTLTIQSGAIVKFGASQSFTIDGTLDVDGTGGSPVILTSISDDTAGGDTNGDTGTTTPSPGDWVGLRFNSGSDASTLDNCELRYGGTSGFAGISLTTADISLTDCTVRDCNFDGLTLNASSFPTVSGCAFNDNNSIAIDNVDIDAIAGFTNNTVSGNGGNYMRVTAGTLDANATIAPENYPGGALHLSSSAVVPDGVTLTLDPGTVMKFGASLTFTVNGTLLASGTSGNRVVFTSFPDDSIGGDTNGDGSSTGSPGNWVGLSFTSNADASVLEECEVRFAGTSGFAAVRLALADVTIASCLVRDAAFDGMTLGIGSFPSVSGTMFTNNGALAVDDVDTDAISGFTNNTASGNGGNYMRITSGTLNSDTTIALANTIGGVVVCATTLTVELGTKLTLQPGVVIKFTASTRITVNGELDANGNPGAGATLTSFTDDSIGGDTNNDGPSSGAPGDWVGMRFNASSGASDLEYLETRYSGTSGFPAITLVQADIRMYRCTVRDSAFDGLSLSANSFPTVRECQFIDNGQIAIDTVPLPALAGLFFNTASGNGTVGSGGDYALVTNTTMTSDVRVDEHNLVSGMIVSSASLSVPSGVKLTLGPGVAIKFRASTRLTATSGSELAIEGTQLRPVVMTSDRDDSVVGDTNADGAASMPAPGNWVGLILSSGSTASVQHALLRYTGTSGFDGVRIQTSAAELVGVTVEHSAFDGFGVDADASIIGCCAFLCGADGFDISQGAVSRCTAVNNTTGGFRRTGAGGSTRDSVAWDNGTNFIGFDATNLFFSDGDATLAGINGNLNVDPLFVDQANGDLNLTFASPCIDMADPLAEVDPDCTPADIGAKPFDAGGAPNLYCVGKTNSEGCVPFADFAGYASATDGDPFTLTGNDVLNNKPGLFFYGLSGSASIPFFGGTLCMFPPLRRTPVQLSGGGAPPNDCSGTYSYAMNARIQSGADTGLVIGATVNGQFWMRDPLSSFGTVLTNAVEFDICP